MSTKTNWTFAAAGQEQNALWGNPGAFTMPPGYDVKRGTNGRDRYEASDDTLNAYDGRGGNDIIVGSANMDFFIGGSGNDKMTLGGEMDIVYFNARLNKSTNVDQIMDFKSGEDQLGLAKSIFSKAGSPGVLKQKAFWSGKKAHDKDDRIIYDKKTGSLYYDPDGTGSAAQVKFAILKNKTALSYQDIWIG